MYRLVEALLAAQIVVAAISKDAVAVEFVVENLANSTPGGERFEQTVGNAKALDMLASASAFINRVLYDGSSIPRKVVSKLIFSVDQDTQGFVAYTVGGEKNESFIHLSDKYVGGYNESPDVAREIEGIIYHESTHVWQWNGQGTAPGGLIEGIADYIRLIAGLAPPHWVKAGAGERWDQGYDITAYFLQYCESLKPGFVRDVNARLALGTWNLNFFQNLLGKSVDQLWADYKAKYARRK